MLSIEVLAKTDPRISRSGVASGVALALVALTLSASGSAPLVLPTEAEGLVSFGSWWVAMFLTAWLALSLLLWLILLERPAHPSIRWLGRLAVPGSRKLAEAMLAVSVLAGSAAACSPGVAEVEPPRIEVLSRGSISSAGPASVVTSAPVSAQPSRDGEAQGGLSVDTTLLRAAPRASAPIATATAHPAGEATATTSVGVGTLADAPPAPLLVDTSVKPTTTSTVELDGEARSPTETRFPALAPEGQSDPATGGTLSAATGALSGRHTVVSGENLWSIAEGRLARVAAVAPTNPEIATYWTRLIEANATTIRSGNPDLIYPGELLVLPPTGE